MSASKIAGGDVFKAMTEVAGNAAHKRLEDKSAKGIWVKGDDKNDLIADAKGFAASHPKQGLEDFLKHEDKELKLNDGQVAALRDLVKDIF
jgi:hypothetical protein